ncbi:MAG: hypothetical protein K0R25_1072 [Rickettsiaceae bacterium]|jgi:hypothetical protein|nr:hypothetical protein [Rickettsiaceae bacterium]
MIIKFLLKIWPALLPILIYCLWIAFKKINRAIIAKREAEKSGKIINATYQEAEKNVGKQNDEKAVGDFSLYNQRFVTILYLSLFIAIICFLFFAIRVPRIEKGEYVPAHIENGKVVPGKIIEMQEGAGK